MHRWFYANEELVCRKAQLEQSDLLDNLCEPLMRRQEHTWRFCVTLCDRELMPNEVVAVTGDCEELGNWEFECCVPMAPVHEEKPNVWRVFINLPSQRDISYRYLIVAIDPDSERMIVRFFESHIIPRKVPGQLENIDNSCIDVFGLVKGSVKVERGWLTTERIIQFMFFKAPFKWHVAGLSERTFNVKVTPFFRKDIGECHETVSREEDLHLEKPIQESTGEIRSEEIEIDNTKKVVKKVETPLCPNLMRSYTKLNFSDSEDVELEKFPEDKQTKKTVLHEESQSGCVKLSTAFAFNEVVNYKIDGSVLVRQPRFGVQCNKEDLVTVHLTIGDFANTVYLIELFTYDKNAAKDESPYLVGYRYVLPEDFKTYTHGYVETPIICASTHRLLGCLKFRFLIIHPNPMLKFDLSVSYLRHWTKNHGAMDVGHRGQGKSFNSQDNIMIYENTLYSIRQAIASGASMVEFDIHLTKDQVPVVYHDFNIHISKRDPKLLQNTDGIDVPISWFTYEGLMNLKLTNIDGDPPEIRIGDAMERQQLFPTLSDILDGIAEHVAFDIEIKWPQQFCDRKWEEGVRPSVDRNIFVDRILEVVMQKAARRRIVFTSFDADICTLLRFKQNRYPVMFLLRNDNNIGYLDARTRTSEISDNFAYAMELLGVVPHANTLIRSPSFIERSRLHDLTIFSYGVETYDDIALLKKFGVSAVILDRMDKFADYKKTLSEEMGGGDGCT